MTHILTSEHSITFDVEDIELVIQNNWYSHKNRNVYYARCTNGVYRGQALHRLIMRPKAGEKIDHINRNGLDNRRCNLRIATVSQNCCNARDRKDRTLPYRGVKFNKTDGRFHARIRLNGKRKHIGSFATAEQAAKAFDTVALQRGEFARLNFPEGRAS